MKELESVEWKITKSKYLPECVIDFLCWTLPSTIKLKVGKDITIWKTSWFSSKL